MQVARANLQTGEVSLQPVDCIDPTGLHKKASAMEMQFEWPKSSYRLVKFPFSQSIVSTQPFFTKRQVAWRMEMEIEDLG